MDRRTFVRACLATAIGSLAKEFTANAAPQTQTRQNLVPRQPGSAPNYWCTWAAQNYIYGQSLSTLDLKVLEGDSGSRLAHDAMTEHVLFGERGWVETFFPVIRGELFFLLDDGWQVGGTSTFEVDTTKFPRFAGPPRERLAMLNNAIEGAGWRGAALWCRNPPGGNLDRHLEGLSQSAGIRYWKIDIGDPDFNLVRLRDEAHFEIKLEHVHGEGPVNGDWRTDGRFGAQPWGSRRTEILRHTDVFRTYDVTSILSLATTIDRLAEMLKGVQGHPEVRGLLNVEDEVYLAAAMGCTMGIMRNPMIGMRPGSDADLFFNGPRQTKRRMDEVARAVRWQRIAPPIAAGSGSFEVSTDVLTDTWTFEAGQTWDSKLVGATARQGAPASIARNMALPEVHARSDRPFVFATRFPKGAVAVGAQERTQVGKAWYMPECSVTLSVADAPGPFAVFGNFGSLTLLFDRSVGTRRVWAQDLAGEEATDITAEVQIRGTRLSIAGEVIRRAGLSNATPGDLSAPGCVIALV